MKTCNFSLRRARLDDDICAIAKYIYLTDPYIYPSISNSPESAEWVDIIEQCYKMEKNVFYYKNIFIALVDDKIVGICCIVPNKKKLEFSERLRLSDELLQKIEGTVKGYFKPLLKEIAELDGYNVVNLCVDESFRNLGIGKKLLNYSISQVETKEVYLDVIADNTSAIRVYQALSFEVEKEYEGFLSESSSILCYKMKKTLK